MSARKADAQITNSELHLLLNQAIAGAGTEIGTGAGAGMHNTPKGQSGETTLYGNYRIDNKNPYLKYSQLSIISPHVFIPLAKLGLAFVSGLRLESKTGNTAALDAMTEWANTVNLTNKAQNIARCVVRDGTSITYLPNDPGVGITDIEILPMQYTSLLPEGIKAGDKPKSLIKGKVDRAIINEANKESTVEMDRPEFGLFRLFYEGYFMTDIMGRQTYGMYGISMLESVDRPIKDLMDLVSGYTGHMRRYGVGRLHIDVPVIEKLILEGKKKEAKQILEDIIASQRKIKANEDIITGGAGVTSLASSHAPDVGQMKESLQTDIHIGLLQSPISMGNTKGSTYASGYVSESDRSIILESVQNILKHTLQTEIIDKQLTFLDYEPGDVTVEVDRLNKPVLDNRLILDIFALGGISGKVLSEQLGLPEFESESI